MKIHVVLSLLILALGFRASAQSANDATAAPSKLQAKEMTVEVVAIDSDAKKITVKKVTDFMDPPAVSQTFSVEGKALASLKDVSAGEKITVTCRAGAEETPKSAEATASAESCLVTGIEKVKAQQ